MIHDFEASSHDTFFLILPRLNIGWSGQAAQVERYITSLTPFTAHGCFVLGTRQTPSDQQVTTIYSPWHVHPCETVTDILY